MLNVHLSQKLTELVKFLKLIGLVKKPLTLIRTEKKKLKTLDMLNFLVLGDMLRKNSKINKYIGEKPGDLSMTNINAKFFNRPLVKNFSIL